MGSNPNPGEYDDTMRYIQAMTTTGKKSEAAAIARSLVKKRLAACVQACPISSTFRWKGKVMEGREWMLLIKARSSDYKKLEKEITRLHSYELPEIIALPIAKGSRRYLNWIGSSTRRQ